MPVIHNQVVDGNAFGAEKPRLDLSERGFSRIIRWRSFWVEHHHLTHPVCSNTYVYFKICRAMTTRCIKLRRQR